MRFANLFVSTLAATTLLTSALAQQLSLYVMPMGAIGVINFIGVQLRRAAVAKR